MKVGDIVKFLNEEGDGVVTKIINKKRVVIDFGNGMEIPVMTDELILISSIEPEEEEEEEIKDEAPQEEEEVDLSVLKNFDFTAKKTNTRENIDIHAFAKSLSPTEVDLHIEKLTDNFVGLSNSEIMLIQLSYFESYMDQGLRGQHRTLIFIHGIGNGVLRKEIRSRLKSYRSIQVSDGDMRKYGFGATAVSFQ